VDADNKIVIGNSSILSNGGYQLWSVYSDGRFKENVSEDVPGLVFINLLRPVTYDRNIRKLDELLGVRETTEWEGRYDAENVRYTGFIAQEVEQAAEQVGYDFSGVDKTGNVMALRYAEFIVPLVKQQTMISKQQAIIEEQGLAIEALRSEVKRLNEENRLH